MELEGTTQRLNTSPSSVRRRCAPLRRPDYPATEHASSFSTAI